MAEQKFYDMTDTAENIDRVTHDLVEVVTEENDGKVLMVEKVVDEETDEVSVNIVEADLPVLEGNRNEIVVFDGKDWGKQSGVYAEGKEVSLFDTLPPAFFDSGRNLNWGDGVLVQTVYTDDLVVTNLVVFDITGDDEVVIYDMQTDELFSSVGFDSGPLFTRETYSNRGSFSISTDPNVITFPALESAENRALGLRPELFNSERKYRFEVSVGEGEYELITSFSVGKDSSNKQVLILKTSNTGTITYSTTEVSSYHTTLSGNPSNIPNKQTTIVGDRNAKEPVDTHFLALSGKARVTAHDNAKLDITHNAQVFMHDDSRLHMDGSSDLFMHDSSRFNMNASSELYMHNTAKFAMSDGAKFRMNGMDNQQGNSPEFAMNENSKFYMSDNGRIDMGDDALLDMSETSKLYMGGNARFIMNGNADDQPTWNSPELIVSKKQLMYNGNGDEFDMGSPSYPSTWPFLSIGRSKVMIGGDNYNSNPSNFGSKFWSDNPNVTEFMIEAAETVPLTITNIVIKDRSNRNIGYNMAEIIYDMAADDSFSSISTTSSPVFVVGSATVTTSPNMITFPANQGVPRYLGIKSSIFDTKKKYTIAITFTGADRPSLSIKYGAGRTKPLYSTLDNGTLYYHMDDKIVVGSTWVKIGTDNGNVQVHMLGNSFTQMTSNSHSEMHNDSFFIMKNRPENSKLETKAQVLYQAEYIETGIFWADLTDAEKLVWYKKADNGHEKVEGSPFFQMVNNSSIDLDDGIDITGDSTGLYLNNEKIATEYSYETEEEGETILNTVNIEKLFTELQSALVRIAELEEIIQTLNP